MPQAVNGCGQREFIHFALQFIAHVIGEPTALPLIYSLDRLQLIVRLKLNINMPQIHSFERKFGVEKERNAPEGSCHKELRTCSNFNYTKNQAGMIDD